MEQDIGDAVRSDNLDRLFQILVESNRPDHGRTIEQRALDDAAWYNSPSIVDELIARGIRPNLDVNGPNALHSAVERENIQIIRSLLDAGVPVDSPNHKEWTALLSAVVHGRVESIHVLFEYNADPLVDLGGGTAAAIAVRNDDTFKILEQHVDYERLRGVMPYLVTRAVGGGAGYACQRLLDLGFTWRSPARGFYNILEDRGVCKEALVSSGSPTKFQALCLALRCGGGQQYQFVLPFSRPDERANSWLEMVQPQYREPNGKVQRYARRLRAALDAYEIVDSSAALPPEMVIPILETAFCFPESFLVEVIDTYSRWPLD